jgi:hypothetical protein
MALSAAVLACAADTEPTAQSQVLDSTTPEPAFERVTVTPVPIDTPTPTAVVETQSKFTDEQLADPVFPDWLDPELSDEQPDDDAIFEGWHEYMNNTFVEYIDARGQSDAVHLCDDGKTFDKNEQMEENFEWGVTRSAAISPSKWGIVALTVEILADHPQIGPAGTAFTVMTMSREGGKVMQTGWGPPTEMTFERSEMCLERVGTDSSVQSELTADQLAAPVFPDWLAPDIATEQPSDQEIFAGWTKYFADTVVNPIGDGATSHYCADGTYFRPTDDEGSTERDEKQWEVTRPSVLPASDWGTVEILGRWYSRTDGKTVLLVRTGPREVVVERSQKCEELSAE